MRCRLWCDCEQAELQLCGIVLVPLQHIVQRGTAEAGYGFGGLRIRLQQQRKHICGHVVAGSLLQR
jgi:hypothetical protein